MILQRQALLYAFVYLFTSFKPRVAWTVEADRVALVQTQSRSESRGALRPLEDLQMHGVS